MVEPANREVVNSFYEQGVNDRDWSVVERALAPDFTHNGRVLGVEGQRRSLESLYAAIPDARVAIDDSMAIGDKVVTRMTWSGTNTGSFMALPASGTRVTWTAISIIRLSGGKIAQAWVNEDDLGILEQIGASIQASAR